MKLKHPKINFIYYKSKVLTGSMKTDKHEEVLREIMEEIETSLKDSRGLVFHQRRLAFSLSLGSTSLLEIYLHKLNILKEGSQINHLWFRKKKESILKQLQNQVTSPINSVESIEKIIDLIVKIEDKRDILAYGAPASESILQEKITLFFQLKELLKC